MIDAHFHLWRIDRGDYGWLAPDSPLHRDYGLDDFRAAVAGTTAGILVQAAATEAETGFLLASARASDGLVRGVVGWTDLAAPDAAARVAALAREPLLRGVRPMLQDIGDTGWILRPEVQPGLAAMTRAGLRLDLLVTPRHFALLPALAARHPALAVVIDHAGKPAIAAGDIAGWAATMAGLAAGTRWCCKLSGLPSEAAADWDAEGLRPYVAHLLDCFGRGG